MLANKDAPRPTLQVRKQQLVREAIWDAATDLFAEKGFDETTVDDIAHAAGVSRRSFFRYFSSKSDLIAHGVFSYGKTLSDAIAACPQTYSLSEVFRRTVVQVAQQTAVHPRTRKIMQIAEKYPAAREAQLSRMAELQERVAEAYARRCTKGSEGDLMPSVLAGLTLSALAVTFRSWFEQDQQDISVTTDQVFATLGHLICKNGQPAAQDRTNRAAPSARKKRSRTSTASGTPGELLI